MAFGFVFFSTVESCHSQGGPAPKHNPTLIVFFTLNSYHLQYERLAICDSKRMSTVFAEVINQERRGIFSETNC